MQTKLTLRLDDKLIRHTKTYARRSGKSISQIVADYFLLFDEKISREGISITPLVKSLKGSLHGRKAKHEDYQRYLEKKYL